MPRESRTAQALGGESFRWGETEHLLAAIADTVASHAWLFIAAHAKSSTDVPSAPTPITRPGQQPHEEGRHIGGRVTYTPEELDRIFASARPKERGD